MNNNQHDWNAQSYDQAAQDSWNNGDNQAHWNNVNQANYARQQAQWQRDSEQRMAEETQRQQTYLNNISQNISNFSSTSNWSETTTSPWGSPRRWTLKPLFSAIGTVTKIVALLAIPAYLALEGLAHINRLREIEIVQFAERTTELTRAIHQEGAAAMPWAGFRPKLPDEASKFSEKFAQLSLSELAKIYLAEDQSKTPNRNKLFALSALLFEKIKQTPEALPPATKEALARHSLHMLIFGLGFYAESPAAAHDYVAFAQHGYIDAKAPPIGAYKGLDHKWTHADHAYAILSRKSSSDTAALERLRNAYATTKLGVPTTSDLSGFYSITEGVCALGICFNPQGFRFHLLKMLN